MKKSLILVALVAVSVAAVEPAVNVLTLIETMRRQGVLKEVVNALVEKGVVCEFRGHMWSPFSGITTFVPAVYYPDGAPPTRTCGVCRLTQTRHLGPWN